LSLMSISCLKKLFCLLISYLCQLLCPVFFKD
jgi:hypothetical protein